MRGAHASPIAFVSAGAASTDTDSYSWPRSMQRRCTWLRQSVPPTSEQIS